MNVPRELRYTKEHEWIRVEGGEAVVGVTDYAQGELGDVIFVELPAPGQTVDVVTRGHAVPAKVTARPMYQHGSVRSPKPRRP